MEIALWSKSMTYIRQEIPITHAFTMSTIQTLRTLGFTYTFRGVSYYPKTTIVFLGKMKNHTLEEKIVTFKTIVMSKVVF